MIFNSINIGSKITALVITVVVITVIAISYLSFDLSKSLVDNKFDETLSLIASERSAKIEMYFENVAKTLNLVQKSELKYENPRILAGIIMPGDTLENTLDNFEDHDFDPGAFLLQLKGLYNLKSVQLLNKSGKVLLSTENNEKFLSSDINLIERASEGIYFSNVNPDRNSIFCAAPLVHVNNEVTVLIIELGMEKVYAMLADSIGMGKSGENLIARKMDNQIQYLVPFKGDSVLKKVPFDSSENNRPMKEALLGRSGSKVTRDYNGEDVLAVWRFIPNVEWGFVAKVNTSEIMSASNQLQDNFLISGLVIIFLSSVISIVYSKFLVAPLLSLKNKIELISKGILPNSIEKLSNDEIGKMAVTVNNLSKGLKRTADFAKEIGKGNLEAKYTSLGREDILGRNLLEMRESLVRRETDDKERTWIISGMAEISEILRNNDKINSLTSKVIEFIVRRIDVVQGAIYITADDDVKEKLVELVATYAYNRKKYLEGRFEFAQGLVGQVVAEKSPIYRIEIPEDYVTITSGILGDKKPSCLMLVPIITNEEIFGVIEVAGFGEISKEKQGFLVEVGEVLARTIYNIKVNGRTRVLLEESRTMARELKQNQEVLSQNAEEMRATQEELQLSNNKLEEQVEEVNKTQKRMQLLLENASEVITIYEEDLVVRYMSPSVESILGYSFKELVGSTDIDKVHPNHQEIYKEMFSDLLTKPKKSVTIQFRYKHKNGNYLWVEAKGTNFLSDKAINGIIINLRDITEKRRAEQEQRMRSKMQALSENSLDIITRLEDGKISYINPVIKGYTGKSPQNFINKKVDEIELNQQIVEQWLTIVEQVNKTNKIVNREMDFPSENNTHVMQVNAIPEFDENKIIESVLLVSHDITERKYIELEIQNKNKKIADSINYAKRIQNAILPDNNLINKKLPDSFILYKPKDVVSGDFPWFAVVDNYLFIAAVDCTGHGVPGALLSLIGYFLLNDIVRSRKIFEPGIILDKLDEGVTNTLRQDQGHSTAKDGMDIALCRINLENREVVFSGAHRPLYVMKNGEMEEIKGNKFAIGGGIYKNQTNFNSVKVELNKNDSVYFCSDGFPDQFGGPENRKFGPKRLRELIVDLHKGSMKNAYSVLDNEWEKWRGREKQTDDVLLIGIKF